MFNDDRTLSSGSSARQQQDDAQSASHRQTREQGALRKPKTSNSSIGHWVERVVIHGMWVLILMVVLSANAEGATHLPMDVSAAKQQVINLLAKSDAGDMPFIVVSVREQKLYLFKNHAVDHVYPVSTAVAGVGSQAGSNKTPLGLHRIAQKFGAGEPVGMIFKARRPTGHIAHIQTKPIKGDGDDVTTRIMWLEGLQPGVNKGPGVDSHARYIYIHGTPEEGLVGTPESHGCVRMKNHDVLKLFDQVSVGTIVDIVR